jgi:hypothetical protein
VTKENKQMKNAFAVLLLTAASLAAQASASTGPTAPKPAKKATAASKATTPQPVTIPADATANADGTFSWTDKQGKQWTFVKTPFGVMRSEVTPAPATSASLTGVKAFDEGDKIRFEQPSPFGVIKWEKKKTEMTDEERDLVTRQAAGQNAKQE